MSLSNIGKSAVQSATGNIEKAIIEILDQRVREKINVAKTESRKASSTADLGKISNKLSEAANAVKETTASVAGQLPVTKEINKMQQNAASKKTKKKRFQVKFNPSQVSFSAIGGSRVEKKDYVKKEGQVDITFQEMKPRIQMNLQLVFDDYERSEAFMLEKFTDVAAAARTGINAAITAGTGKTYSVRPQVEGFMGALRNSYTRKVNFYWGKMTYRGEINEISAEYTMFSTDGNPIRANINIGILLVDGELGYQYMRQWMKSYLAVFGKDEITNAGNVMQNVGNLLNLNL